jgi:hypothetical protein
VHEEKLLNIDFAIALPFPVVGLSDGEVIECNVVKDIQSRMRMNSPGAECLDSRQEGRKSQQLRSDWSIFSLEEENLPRAPTPGVNSEAWAIDGLEFLFFSPTNRD